jgi:hypothetical protein
MRRGRERYVEFGGDGLFDRQQLPALAYSCDNFRLPKHPDWPIMFAIVTLG